MIKKEFVLKLVEILLDMSGDRNIFMYGDNSQYIEKNHGINIRDVVLNQDLDQAESYIQELLDKFKKDGVTDDDAQKQIAEILVNQAKKDSAVKNKLQEWVKLIKDTAAKTSISEAVKRAINLAWNLLSS